MRERGGFVELSKDCTDDKIVELFLKRDETAISESQHKYGNLLSKIAFNILNNNEDSEECVDDTYIKAWNSIPPTVPKFLCAYLSKITRNLSINRWHELHTKKRDYGVLIQIEELSECIPSQNSVEVETDQKVLSAIINDWLKLLNQDDRVLFLRRYFFADSMSTLAFEFGTTEKKLASKLFRLRQKLKLTLERNGVSL